MVSCWTESEIKLLYEKMTRDKAIVLLINILPYSNQISNIHSFNSMESIRFTWRHTEYSFMFKHLSIEICDNGMLLSNNESKLMQALLRTGYDLKMMSGE